MKCTKVLSKYEGRSSKPRFGKEKNHLSVQAPATSETLSFDSPSSTFS